MVMTKQKATLQLQNSLDIAEFFFLPSQGTLSGISNVPNSQFEKGSFISNKNDCFSISGLTFLKIAPSHYQK